MQEELPEYGRFKPKGGKPSEPREPFLPDEMLEPSHKPETPSIRSLHVPNQPLTKPKLAAFLVEIRPIAAHLSEMSRKDQHLVGTYLQEVKNSLHAADFSEEEVKLFEKIVDHFNELLVHSRPVDQDAVLKAIESLELKL